MPVLPWMLLAAVMTLTSCGKVDISQALDEMGTETDLDSSLKDEIESWDSDMAVVGSITHGARIQDAPELEENGYLTYSGGEMVIPYNVTVSGASTNAGFLVFVDGQPQAYHIDGQAEDTYCHQISAEDGEEMDFNIYFTPCAGEKGEMAKVTILSIYYANFRPDMVESSAYGLYHQSLEWDAYIYMEADAEAVAPQESPAVIEVRVAEEDMTQDFLEGPIALQYGTMVLDQDMLDEDVYYVPLIDGEIHWDNYALSSDTVELSLEMCGIDGSQYIVTPFADHEPLCEGSALTVKKGKVSSVSVTVDASALDDFSTFYFVAIPIGESSLMHIKTNSCLLYKESQ